MSTKISTKSRVLMVLPTLGQRTDLLVQTLNSIRDQAPTKVDIAMVFPLGNSETRKIAKDFGAMMVEDPGSLSSAVNAGVAQAKPHHEYIGWIGDDDLLTKDSLKTAVAALDANPDAVLAYGYCDYIDIHNKHIFTSRAGRLAPWIMTWGPNLVPLIGLVFRRSSLNQAGEFDVTNKWSMDLDMLLRLRKMGKFLNVKRAQACFRWHASSNTVSNRPKVLDETEQVKRRYLPRSLRIIAPLWEHPVRWATKLAVNRVNRLASRKSK